jgi:hypothetical protein
MKVLFQYDLYTIRKYSSHVISLSGNKFDAKYDSIERQSRKKLLSGGVKMSKYKNVAKANKSK